MRESLWGWSCRFVYRYYDQPELVRQLNARGTELRWSAWNEAATVPHRFRVRATSGQTRARSNAARRKNTARWHTGYD